MLIDYVEWLEVNAEAAQVIDSSLVHKGDVLRLVAGETVPADGLLMGAVGLDESLMTVSFLLSVVALMCLYVCMCECMLFSDIVDKLWF